jgi:hypothetical protein
MPVHSTQQASEQTPELENGGEISEEDEKGAHSDYENPVYQE